MLVGRERRKWPTKWHFRSADQFENKWKLLNAAKHSWVPRWNTGLSARLEMLGKTDDREFEAIVLLPIVFHLVSLNSSEH